MMHERPAPGTTGGQPFLPGTGGSEHFRIPALAALEDGTLIAACDARWDHRGDGGGLDTVVSVSRDGGSTWHYSFPNYLGDNGDRLDILSTAFIDPALATDGKRIWMLVDLWPAGIALNTARYRPVPGGNGFDQAGRLRLRAVDPVPIGEEGYGEAAAKADYPYSLDLETMELSPPLEGYQISPFFDIRTPDGHLTNLFCADSPLRVYPTDYLYLTYSDDGGAHWSPPELPDLKREGEESFLVGPGAGAVRGDHLIFSAYEHTLGFERACLIWRDAMGWHRSEAATRDTWSSEGAPVVLPDGAVRLFYRDGFEQVRYTDYHFSGGNYVPTAMEQVTAAPKTARNQLSAVRAGDRIFLSTAIGKDMQREKGAVHVFRLGKSGMTLERTVPITDGHYAYSAITALTEGRLGLLYECAGSEIRYITLPMDSE